MTIFVPILIICLNGNCEWMQAQTYFQSEEACRASLTKQKSHMLGLVKKAGKDQPELLEGTCVDVKIKSLTEKQA